MQVFSEKGVRLAHQWATARLIVGIEVRSRLTSPLLEGEEEGGVEGERGEGARGEVD